MVIEHVMFKFQGHHEESDDDTLSLRDLPLSNNTNDNPRSSRRSSSEPSDFFEFLITSDFTTSDMCSANDVILCGKLVPFKHLSPPSSTTTTNNNNTIKPTSSANQETNAMHHRAPRRRSGSLSEFEISAIRSNSSKKKLCRNSRSLDYRRLQDMDRNPSFKSVGKSKSSSSLSSSSSSEFLSKRGSKSRWYYVFMFGIPKFPAEMELNDIKNRQLRRCPSTLFPTAEAAAAASSSSGDFPSCRSGGRGSWNWKILSALSCKGHASVPVTTTFLPEV